MEYKVLKRFKCREQKMKVFSAGDGYATADESRAENLIKLGFIEKVEVPVKPPVEPPVDPVEPAGPVEPVNPVNLPEKPPVKKPGTKKDDAK